MDIFLFISPRLPKDWLEGVRAPVSPVLRCSAPKEPPINNFSPLPQKTQRRQSLGLPLDPVPRHVERPVERPANGVHLVISIPPSQLSQRSLQPLTCFDNTIREIYRSIKAQAQSIQIIKFFGTAFFL